MLRCCVIFKATYNFTVQKLLIWHPHVIERDIFSFHSSNVFHLPSLSDQYSCLLPRTLSPFTVLALSLTVVQSLSHVWLFATPWAAHARLPCSSLSPGVSTNLCPNPAISPLFFILTGGSDGLPKVKLLPSQTESLFLLCACSTSLRTMLLKTMLCRFVQNLNLLGFADGSEVKNPLPTNEDVGLIPGKGRSPGVANGNPL